MTMRLITTVMLTALVGAAAGCGDLSSADGAPKVRYTPDGSLVVFSDHIEVFDAQLGARKASIPIPSGYFFNLSDDGTVAALVSPTDTGSAVELFQIPSGNRLSRFDLGPTPADKPGYGPEDMALSPHGDLLYVMGPVNGMYRMTGMFDTRSGALLWSADWAIEPVFSVDGSTVYVSGKQGKGLLGFNARTGAPSLDAPFPIPNWDGQLGTMWDAHTLIALRTGGCQTPQLISFSNGSVVKTCPMSIDFISTDDGSMVKSFPLTPNTVVYGRSLPLGLAAFRCSPSAGLCAIGVDPWDPVTMLAGEGVVQVWRMDGTLAQTIPHVWVDDLSISPDGQFLAIATDGDVRVHRISDGARVATRHYSQPVF